MTKLKSIANFFSKYPLLILILLYLILYYQFFLLGKIPVPTDLLVGAYLPWLDYKWGHIVGVAVKNPLISDVFSQFFVWKYLSIEMIKNGQLPLWNKFAFSGTPLLATYHSAVLNPFNILLFLPKYFGWGLYIFFQTLVAGLGMYFFLGTFIKNPYSKILGALVFSLSGLMTTWVELGTGVYAASMLPWIGYSIEKYLSTQRFRYIFLFILSFVTLYLSGHVQLTQYATILFLIYLSYRVFKQKNSIQTAIFFCIALFLSWGIIGIQLLPTLDFSKYTIRNTDIPMLGEYHDGLNNLSDLIRFIIPDFYGNPTTYNFWGQGSYHEQASFLGILTLPLVVSLLFYKRTRLTWFWLIIFFLSIFFAYKNPFTNWFYSLKIPLLTYSNASRTFFITGLASGILVGIAVSNFLEDIKFRNLFKKIFFAFAVMVLLFMAIVFYNYHSTLDPQTKSHLFISLRNSVFQIVILITFVGAILFIKKIKLLLAVLILLMFLDLGRNFLKYNPFVDQNLIFPKTPIISYLEENLGNARIARTDQVLFPPNTWTYYQISSAEGYDAMLSEDYKRFFHIVNGNKYSDPVIRYIDLKKYPSPFVDSLNIKYLLAVKRDKDGNVGGDILDYQVRDSGYKKVFEDKNTVILENTKAVGLVYSIDNLLIFNNKSEVVSRIEQRDFNPTKEAIVLINNSLNIQGLAQVSKIRRVNNNEIEFFAKSNKNSFAIISESYNDGWKAYMDGKDIPIYKTNLTFMGVVVPEGEHDFKLVYYPDSFGLGWKISLGSLLLAISIGLYCKYKMIW